MNREEAFFARFRKPMAAGVVASGKVNMPTLATFLEFEGPWKVLFDPKWGGPAEVTFESLTNWSKHPEACIIFTRFSHIPLQGAKTSALMSQAEGVTILSSNNPSHERILTIHFDTAFPHVIRNWTEKTTSGITTATLEKGIMNVAYRDMHDPEDSSKRKELGLDPVAN